MKVIVDKHIPYITGRLEPLASVEYLDQSEFTAHAVKDADALLIRTRTQCDEPLLKDSKVKFVATATIGTDQINRDWCESHGITVASAPGCNAPAVAQYVWSALLSMGFDPTKGEKLGIVGCGHIGSIVKAWGEAMGAQIMVCDPPLARNADVKGEFHSLDELLSQCKAVTLHTPLSKNGRDATYHLIGEKELDLLGDNKIFINASRGAVVDNKALLNRLKRGGLRVALDVWEGEPVIDPELLSMVDYGTFHIAGYSREGKSRATRMVLEALSRKFGIAVDTSGLEPPYLPLSTDKITARGIMLSYDLTPDSDALKQNPEKFEELRSSYVFRPEFL